MLPYTQPQSLRPHRLGSEGRQGRNPWRSPPHLCIDSLPYAARCVNLVRITIRLFVYLLRYYLPQTTSYNVQ